MQTKSIWKETTENKNSMFPILTGKIDSDIVIIGGGITGLITAYFLQKSGRKVSVVESFCIGDGTTGYSSCHLTTDLDFEYQNIISKHNEETAKIVAASRTEGINIIENIVQEYNIECDFRRLKGYYYTEVENEIENLKKEAQSASIVGLDVSLTDNVPLPFKTLKAIIFENQAEFNSQKFIIGLSKILKEGNVQIYENSRVINIIENEDYCVVGTAEGRINAQHVVLATHLPLLFNVLQTMAAPYRSYMVTAKLNNDQYPDGLFWDTTDPYFYTKTYISNGEKWLVVGGLDHKTGDKIDTEGNYVELENYVKERYDVHSFEHKWSSQYYEPVDGLPYIGKNPFSKMTYVATGFSGDGLVYGVIAAQIISDLINGIENKFQKVFDSTRFTPIASVKEFIKENAEVFSHFIKDRFTIEKEHFKDLLPGEGKILEKEGEKVAAARDINNELYVLSPVCPHLKCFVQWNNGEKTWDCPCHGSRFNIKGEVLYGPAVKDLERKTYDE